MENDAGEYSIVPEVFAREMEGAETHVAFREIEIDLNVSTRRISRAIVSSQELWAGEIIDRLLEAFQTGPIAIDSAVRVPRPMRRMLATTIMREQRTLHTLGELHVQRELNAQQGIQLSRTEPPQVKKVVELFRARADMGVDRFARQTEGIIRDTAVTAYRTFGSDITPVEMERMLADALDVSGRQSQLVARTLTSESFNMGRDRRAQLHMDAIRDVQYSALLDANTCPVCANRDGTIVTLNSNLYFELMPPNHACHGRTRCRCMWIYRRYDEDEVLSDRSPMFV